MKCLYRADCQATGEPQPPNDVFICPECLTLIWQKAQEAFKVFQGRLARHQNN